MSRPQNQALTRALDELARPTTPDELKRRGIRKLHSVSLADLSRMVEQSVNRTLMSRIVSADSKAVDTLANQAQGELFGLLDQHKSLKERRAEISALRTEIEDDHAPSGGDPRVGILERRVHKLLRQLEDTEAALELALRSLDKGLPSVYAMFRELDSEDPLYEQKMSALRRVFEANVELQDFLVG